VKGRACARGSRGAMHTPRFPSHAPQITARAAKMANAGGGAYSGIIRRVAADVDVLVGRFDEVDKPVRARAVHATPHAPLR
jgi:hypothetical protein